MSGQLLAHEPGDEPSDRHVHAVLELGPRTGGAPPAGEHTTPSETGSRCVPPVDAPEPPPEAAGAGDAPVTVWFRDPRTFGELRPLPGGAPVAPDLFDHRL